MSVESNAMRRQSSKPSVERMFRKKKFGTIVRALWPDKPALNLSQRLGCSERAAQFYIDGQRKPTARTVLVVVAEMLE